MNERGTIYGLKDKKVAAGKVHFNHVKIDMLIFDVSCFKKRSLNFVGELIISINDHIVT